MTQNSQRATESPLYQSCCAKIDQIRNYLGVAGSSVQSATPNLGASFKSPTMGGTNGEDLTWYALLLVVPLSLLGLMFGMTHHVLLFLAAMAETVLRSLCAQWSAFKDSEPKVEQYVFFCLISAPIMMILASAWIALTACCHLNRIFLSSVPEDLNNFLNNKLIN